MCVCACDKDYDSNVKYYDILLKYLSTKLVDKLFKYYEKKKTMVGPSNTCYTCPLIRDLNILLLDLIMRETMGGKLQVGLGKIWV